MPRRGVSCEKSASWAASQRAACRQKQSRCQRRHRSSTSRLPEPSLRRPRNLDGKHCHVHSIFSGAFMQPTSLGINLTGAQMCPADVRAMNEASDELLVSDDMDTSAMQAHKLAFIAEADALGSVPQPMT